MTFLFVLPSCLIQLLKADGTQKLSGQDTRTQIVRDSPSEDDLKDHY